MEKDNENAYSEVIEILKLVDDEKKLEALPMEMLEVLKSKANPEYKPQISKEIPLEEQNLQPETFSILSWIAIKYWNDDINEEENNQNDDEQMAKENKDEKIEEKDSKAIDKEILETENVTATTLPILNKDLKWYQKIRIKIIELFNKIFKKNKCENYVENKEEGSNL